MSSQHVHLQIEFEFTCAAHEYRKLADNRAPTLAAVPGLVSKLWIVDEERRRAGGAYLFADRAAAHAYLEGPIVAALKANPAFRQLDVRVFDVIEAPSTVTRAL